MFVFHIYFKRPYFILKYLLLNLHVILSIFFHLFKIHNTNNYFTFKYQFFFYFKHNIVYRYNFQTKGLDFLLTYWYGTLSTIYVITFLWEMLRVRLDPIFESNFSVSNHKRVWVHIVSKRFQDKTFQKCYSTHFSNFSPLPRGVFWLVRLYFVFSKSNGHNFFIRTRIRVNFF